ncbi:hypothetical protein MNBD_GAMMA12-2678 [hydrothermal vent metagenome]|uniref:Uncharacterized protein n=1 Tax=hydrothermal vent metagenome TaxID=652676 RepID=A0A3B0Y8R8_9ZZZZ
MKKDEFTLLHPSNLQISSKTTEGSVLAINGVKKRDMKTSWVWYDLPIAKIYNKNVILSLVFRNRNLNSLTITLEDNQLYGSNWNDWEEKKEKLRVAHTTLWFEKAGYSLGKYTWGEVWSSFDQKSGLGNGGINYYPCQ